MTTCLETMSGSIDREAILDRVGGDVELLREITEIFLREYSVLLDDIAVAIGKPDSYLLERSAHNLKGCISNFGAVDAVAAAYRLENMGRHKQLGDAEQALVDLKAALGQLQPELLALLA